MTPRRTLYGNKSNLPRQEIGLKSPKLFSRVRSTIETAFYRNNVVEVTTLAQAYELAKAAPGTIITDQVVATLKS
jgi:phosphoenolpyruvate carboxykinase (ATP)